MTPTICPLIECNPTFCGKDACPRGTKAAVEKLRLTAILPVRQMRGGSCPVLARASDDRDYVVKFRQNPQGHRTLINELLASTILRVLDLRVPDFSIINVTEDFLELLQRSEISEGLRRLHIRPGLHFASKLSVDPTRHAVYDILPTPLLPKVTNLGDFARILVVDKWLANRDSRQAVFFRDRQFVAEMIDNGLAFGGEAWELTDYPSAGPHRDPAVYDKIHSFDDLEPHALAVKDYPESQLTAAVRQLPDEWLDIPGDKQLLEAMLDRLVTKRKRISCILEDFVSLHGGTVFRQWGTTPTSIQVRRRAPSSPCLNQRFLTTRLDDRSNEFERIGD